jgi:hypothetical protein
MADTLSLKTITRLDENNYNEWMQTMGIYLLTLGAHSYIVKREDVQSLDAPSKRLFYNAVFAI